MISVEYECPCGHYAPLSAMFYSELCHKLVCRQPSCSVEEFETYYCGYLLTNMASKEANMYQNRSSRCFACVTCRNVLSTVFHETLHKYFLACSHCHWDSLELGLMEDDPDMLIMTAVAHERETQDEDIFHTLLSYHTTAPSGASKSQYRPFHRKGSGIRGFGQSSLDMLASTMKGLQRDQHMRQSRMLRMAAMGSWKYEDAMRQIEERAQRLVNLQNEHEWTDLQLQLQPFIRANSNAEMEVELNATQSAMNQVSSLSQRFLMPLEQPRDVTQLFPYRPPLRVKRTWRCVESIERGSAGILVKPQINPITGDSSLLIPGSWFKKANLGVHFIPRITFQTLPHVVSINSEDKRSSVRVECVLLIDNPLEDSVQLVVQSDDTSTATDERSCDKVLMDDPTPILVGAYEDPSIADAFGSSSSNGNIGNRFVVSSVRNLVKIRVPIQVQSVTSTTVSFCLKLEMMKMDDALQEAIVDSKYCLNIAFIAPITTNTSL